MRLTTDLFAYCAERIPSWNTISISGYHIREAGSTAVQELAFTLANGIAYCDAAVARGPLAGRLRRARSPSSSTRTTTSSRRWRSSARRGGCGRAIMRERFGATNPKALALRFHAQTGGSTLTAQQPENNVVRVAIQALVGGVRRRAVAAHELVRRGARAADGAARRGSRCARSRSSRPRPAATDTADPLGGSYYIEALTDELERRALGADRARSTSSAAPSRRSSRASCRTRSSRRRSATSSEVEAGERVIVGVNRFHEDEEEPIELHRLDPEAERRQLERTARRARGAERRRGAGARSRACARRRAGRRTCCRRCARRCARAARSARSATCCATSGACTTRSARRRERRARLPPRDERPPRRHGRGRGADARDASAGLQGLRRRASACRSRCPSPARSSATAPASSARGHIRGSPGGGRPLARVLERRRALPRRGVRRGAPTRSTRSTRSRPGSCASRRRRARSGCEAVGCRGEHVRRAHRHPRAYRLEVHGARLPPRLVGRRHDARESPRARGRRGPRAAALHGVRRRRPERRRSGSTASTSTRSRVPRSSASEHAVTCPARGGGARTLTLACSRGVGARGRRACVRDACEPGEEPRLDRDALVRRDAPAPFGANVRGYAAAARRACRAAALVGGADPCRRAAGRAAGRHCRGRRRARARDLRRRAEPARAARRARAPRGGRLRRDGAGASARRRRQRLPARRPRRDRRAPRRPRLPLGPARGRDPRRAASRSARSCAAGAPLLRRSTTTRCRACWTRTSRRC